MPLRETFDPESRLNRQLAKQTYEREKIERVHQKKEELMTKAQAEAMAAQKKKEKTWKRIQAEKVKQKKEDETRYEEIYEKRRAVKEANTQIQQQAIYTTQSKVKEKD